MTDAVPALPSFALIPSNMDQAMRLAEMMSRGKLMPEHLRNPSDALMVVELAMRLGMSPFAVAQSTSVIQGKLMLEGKLVAAALNASGIMSSRLTYKHSGDGASRAVMVSGVLKGETEPRQVTVTLQEAKTNNGMWTKQPDQQLVYAGTRVWARRHAPEVMLGVYAAEEFDHDMPAKEPHNGPTIEHEEPSERDRINASVPLRTAAADMKRGARITERAPEYEALVTEPTLLEKPANMPGYRDFLKSLETAMRACRSRTEVNRLIVRPETQYAQATYKDDGATQLAAICAEALARFPAPPPDVEAEASGWPGDDLEIKGEEKIMAGD